MPDDAPVPRVPTPFDARACSFSLWHMMDYNTSKWTTSVVNVLALLFSALAALFVATAPPPLDPAELQGRCARCSPGLRARRIFNALSSPRALM